MRGGQERLVSCSLKEVSSSELERRARLGRPATWSRRFVSGSKGRGKQKDEENEWMGEQLSDARVEVSSKSRRRKQVAIYNYTSSYIVSPRVEC